MRRVPISAGLLTLTLFTIPAGCGGNRNVDLTPIEPIDFSSAVAAEVRNAQGQAVLSGRFAVLDTTDEDTERKAPLTATAVDPDATGEAEVEVSGSGDDRRQEVEFNIANVEPRAVFTFVIDGRVVATATANDRGQAEMERSVPLPAGSLGGNRR